MLKHKLMVLGVTALAALLAGCATAPATPQGAAVELATQRPANCKFLGEVTGSHGNVFSGDFITDEFLQIVYNCLNFWQLWHRNSL